MVKYYRGKEELYDDGVELPTWVYHPTAGRKIVGRKEALELYQQGWFDSPAFLTAPEPGSAEEAETAAEEADEEQSDEEIKTAGKKKKAK